jgi:8-oxo-dGTP pyrophosphatase MutT (NUDIX family)
MKIKILCKTDWVSLRRMIDPENGVNGYDYLHEDRCDGKIVAILPYRYNDSNDRVEYLLRKEVTPCWGMEQKISSITGGVENDNAIDTAIHEIAEEAGYEIKRSDLKFLDLSYGTKSSTTKYYLYTVDLTGKEKTLAADGDGSELEKMAECFWSDTIEDAVDPLVYVLHYRILQTLQK